MSPHHNNHRCNRQHRRSHLQGMTLLELTLATTILVMIAGAMTALASVVQSSSDISFTNATVTQHGRVALERIERAISSATATEYFPGCFVYSEQIDRWTYPDTLIVWYPEEAPADPDGFPFVDELVVFCPNPNSPTDLLEIRLRDGNGAAPALDDTDGWQMLMTEFKYGNTATRVSLTHLLRVAAPGIDSSMPERGVVRFDVRLCPSADEWNEFKLGTRQWNDLSWAQGIHGSGTGLRQTWCRIELQLQTHEFTEIAAPNPNAGKPKPGGPEGVKPRPDTRDADTTTPFFGSGTVYHELHRS